MKLTEREIELLDGMIETYRSQADSCDKFPNHSLAEMQKGRCMERIALLGRVKASKNDGAMCRRCGSLEAKE